MSNYGPLVPAMTSLSSSRVSLVSLCQHESLQVCQTLLDIHQSQSVFPNQLPLQDPPYFQCPKLAMIQGGQFPQHLSRTPNPPLPQKGLSHLIDQTEQQNWWNCMKNSVTRVGLPPVACLSFSCCINVSACL